MVSLQILNKVLNTHSIDLIQNNDLTVDYFPEYDIYYDFIMDHYNKYGSVPDRETMANFVGDDESFVFMDVTESDKYLVSTIKDEWLYHKLVETLNKTSSIMKTNSSDAIDFLKSNLSNIQVSNNSDGIDIIKDASIRYNEYVNRTDKEQVWCLSTGFQELDKIIGGLAVSEEFMVIVARTNQGKSWILNKMVTHIWGLGFNVGYISPEMSASKIGYRFDTLREHFSNVDILRGNDVPNYKEYIDDLQKNKYQFRVATPLDFDKQITIGKLRNFVKRNNLSVLAIDGITYIKDERGNIRDNKTTSLTNVSEDLMALSLELKIPIITVVQANRSGIPTDMADTSTPDLESIRDSDGIAHNATKVISIRQLKDGKLKMSVKKNRDGKVGVNLVYKWNINIGDFEFESSDDEYNESEIPSHKYNNNVADSRQSSKRQSTVVNRQPLVRNNSKPSVITAADGDVSVF